MIHLRNVCAKSYETQIKRWNLEDKKQVHKNKYLMAKIDKIVDKINQVIAEKKGKISLFYDA